VIWPASDPLVTSVGGTRLCVDAVTGIGVDVTDPPTVCAPAVNPASQRETAWPPSGGGYSIIFPRPAFQNTLPAGSTFVGSSAGAPGPNSNMRGVPDVAYQASPGTGGLIYITLPPFNTTSDVSCGSTPCSTGWYLGGGTSSSAPQWRTDCHRRSDGGSQARLYQSGPVSDRERPSQVRERFFRRHGELQPEVIHRGLLRVTGWDAVTGLGTPNAANLIPDLIAATP